MKPRPRPHRGAHRSRVSAVVRTAYLGDEVVAQVREAEGEGVVQRRTALEVGSVELQTDTLALLPLVKRQVFCVELHPRAQAGVNARATLSLRPPARPRFLLSAPPPVSLPLLRPLVCPNRCLLIAKPLSPPRRGGASAPQGAAPQRRPASRPRGRVADGKAERNTCPPSYVDSQSRKLMGLCAGKGGWKGRFTVRRKDRERRGGGPAPPTLVKGWGSGVTQRAEASRRPGQMICICGRAMARQRRP